MSTPTIAIVAERRRKRFTYLSILSWKARSFLRFVGISRKDLNLRLVEDLLH